MVFLLARRALNSRKWRFPARAVAVITKADNDIFSAMLAQLDEVVGGSPTTRQPVADRSPRYTDGFLLGGIDVVGEGRRVWRLSLQTNCSTYSDSAPPECGRTFGAYSHNYDGNL